MVPMGPHRPHIFRRRPENQDASLFLFWKGGGWFWEGLAPHVSFAENIASDA